jgi:hypothetical protein
MEVRLSAPSRAAGGTSQTPKWGQSLRKVTSVVCDVLCPRSEYREVGGTTWRERLTNEALGRGVVFERQANHTGGARSP